MIYYPNGKGRQKHFHSGKPLKQRPTVAEFQRFFSNIDDKSCPGCWLWTGLKDKKGYGVFCFRRRNMGAHRFSKQAFDGPFKLGHQANHVAKSKGGCENRACVHPDHLEPLTFKKHLKETAKQTKAKKKKIMDDIPF